jgi:succinate dehydrogenase/fumarate reductase flavoprotein subunit
MGVNDESKVYNTNFIEFLEFQNMLEICEKVVTSALKRDESCGAHYMEDLS